MIDLKLLKMNICCTGKYFLVYVALVNIFSVKYNSSSSLTRFGSYAGKTFIKNSVEKNYIICNILKEIFMCLCIIHAECPLIGRFTVRPYDRKNAISFCLLT